MPTLALLNQAGQAVGEINLNDAVFGVESNQQVIYDVVKAQRAAMRQGTNKTKTRGEVSGGGRKPYRQKGTGRARQGSIRAPQWVGGAIIFGPIPRSYDYKKIKRWEDGLRHPATEILKHGARIRAEAGSPASSDAGGVGSLMSGSPVALRVERIPATALRTAEPATPASVRSGSGLMKACHRSAPVAR